MWRTSDTIRYDTIRSRCARVVVRVRVQYVCKYVEHALPGEHLSVTGVLARFVYTRTCVCPLHTARVRLRKDARASRVRERCATDGVRADFCQRVFVQKFYFSTL